MMDLWREEAVWNGAEVERCELAQRLRDVNKWDVGRRREVQSPPPCIQL